MIAEQPLIKPAVESRRAWRRRPSARVGGRARILERAGNVVWNAGIAVAFALGVVEPDASGLGGDGQAILFPQGHVRAGGDRIQGHARRAARCPTTRPVSRGRRAHGHRRFLRWRTSPGIVARPGLSLQAYGSRKVEWADLWRRRSRSPTRASSSTNRLPTTIAGGYGHRSRSIPRRQDLPAGRKGPEGRRSLRQQDKPNAAALAQGRRPIVLRRIVGARSRPTWPIRGGDHLRGSHAVTGDRKQAARRPLPRPSGLLGAAAGVQRLQMVENAPDLDNYMPKRGATSPTDADYFTTDRAWRVRDGGARIAAPSAIRSIWEITSNRRMRSIGSS